MLYVAGEILVWMILAFALGIAVGWFVWGYRSSTERAKVEADHRNALALAQQEADHATAHLQQLLAARAKDTDTISRLQATAAAATVEPGEVLALRQQVHDLESRLASATEERAEAEERAGAAENILEVHDGWEPVGEVPGMAEAHDVLGKPVVLDDLKVVEGVGPKIEEILQGAGIASWKALATATPERLRSILDNAGPQYQVHDPSSWPQQAVLALGGHWDTLRTLQDNLRGGQS
jgi:predicted flap endonuclease-1-like 5' DNA nuclease